MIVRLVDADTFFEAFPLAHSVYGERAFLELNACRAEAVRHFAGYDQKGCARLGIVLGYRQSRWLAPYSAPFGEIAWSKPQGVETIYDFVSELADMLEDHAISVTLAPALYDAEMLPKEHIVLGNYAEKTVLDINYHYPLERFDAFEEHLSRAARKNFHTAMRQGFVFEQTSDAARAYAVIKANRESKGYPLAMSMEQVVATVAPAGPVQADFFVMSREGEDVAAAMVYHAAPGVAQVIYWGDAPGYSAMRPMNALPYFLMGHYRRAGFRIVDIGPSSTGGVPNPGLCDFKESLGCLASAKPTFVIANP